MKIPANIINAIQHPELNQYKRFLNRNEEDVEINKTLTPELIQLILEKATEFKDNKTIRACNSILNSQKDPYNTKIPNIGVATDILKNYIKKNMIKGWLFKKESTNTIQAYLVKSIEYIAKYREEPAYIKIYTVQNHPTKKTEATTIVFEPKDITNKTPEQALKEEGYIKETPELHTEYDNATQNLKKLIGQYSKQYIAKKYKKSRNYYQETNTTNPVKAILNTKINEIPSQKFDETELADFALPVPQKFEVEIFNLEENDYYNIHPNNLTPYVYNPNLKDSLILPESHHELIEILTQNLEVLNADVIQGKTSNIILTHGRPGVGKTLTAEIYAEIIQKPLYRLQTAELGTNANQIEDHLKKVLNRTLEWDCPLLLDEADVFIAERNLTNLNQCAIVAAFLRILEYHNGLIFMTSNRKNIIDEAILSRCSAIISYDFTPTKAEVIKVWKLMAKTFQTTIDDKLLEEIYTSFHHIAPRDVKMLLRLTLRLAQKRNLPLSIQLLKECAAYRDIIPNN